MNTFFLNGQQYKVHKPLNLYELLDYFDYNLSLIVVEHNSFICNSKNWKNILVQNKDKIEVITIVGGG